MNEEGLLLEEFGVEGGPDETPATILPPWIESQIAKTSHLLQTIFGQVGLDHSLEIAGGSISCPDLHLQLTFLHDDFDRDDGEWQVSLTESSLTFDEELGGSFLKELRSGTWPAADVILACQKLIIWGLEAKVEDLIEANNFETETMIARGDVDDRVG